MLRAVLLIFLLLLSLSFTEFASAQPFSLEKLQMAEQIKALEGASSEMRVLGGITLLSFIPIIVVSMTAFLRIVIVLSLLRHALGVQQTPPNIALIALALFLTFFTMEPTFNKMQQQAISPYQNGDIEITEAVYQGYLPLKEFMISQTRERDIAAIIHIANKDLPNSVEELEFSTLIPAFMLSELTAAFKIAFVIFIPFLLIDLIVATVLMSLGMIMLPPITVALPLKIMLFVLIDGWSLLSESLISSFTN